MQDVVDKPLDCSVCNNELRNPVQLACLHVFCGECVIGLEKCVLCSSPISETPPIDKLAKFLVESAHETAEQCANCDQTSQPMFYCETCQQALCSTCRISTHQARMFCSHRMVGLEERSKVISGSNCALHGEPYILYCVDEKRLVCIQCFNGRPLESRHSFVSIETAHTTSIEKLERAAAKLRLFQMEKREEIEVRNRMLNEVDEKFEKQKTSIVDLWKQISECAVEVKDRLLSELEEEKKIVHEECTEQIRQLNSLMSPIRLFLLSAQLLCSSASKVDFLQLHADLMKRIQAVLSKSIPRPPATSTHDPSDLGKSFAQALEPFIGLNAGIYTCRNENKEGSGSASYTARNGSLYAASSAYSGVVSKYHILVDLTGAFREHFLKIEQPIKGLFLRGNGVVNMASGEQQNRPIKEMGTEIGVLTRRVQEVQRDLTMRRCLVGATRIDELIKNCSTVDSRLGLHSAVIDEVQPELQQLWQEQLDRVRRQQLMYREKLDQCIGLRDTARQLLTAAKQLAPFAACIENMSALIDPRRCHPPDPAPMESICMQISTIEPNSSKRIQAIEEEEHNRRLLLEAKRKEEEADREGSNLKLHKSRVKKKSCSRPIVCMSRERSPGGSDLIIAPLSTLNSRTHSVSTLSEAVDLEDAEKIVEESVEDEKDREREEDERSALTSAMAETESRDGEHMSEEIREVEERRYQISDDTPDEQTDAASALLMLMNGKQPVSAGEERQQEDRTKSIRSPPLDPPLIPPNVLRKLEGTPTRENRSIFNSPSNSVERSETQEDGPASCGLTPAHLALPVQSITPPPPLSFSSGQVLNSPSPTTMSTIQDFLQLSKPQNRGDGLASRITGNIVESRDSVLRSLHQVFADREDEERSPIEEQPNVLASAVRMAERNKEKTTPRKKTAGKQKEKTGLTQKTSKGGRNRQPAELESASSIEKEDTKVKEADLESTVLGPSGSDQVIVPAAKDSHPNGTVVALNPPTPDPAVNSKDTTKTARVRSMLLAGVPMPEQHQFEAHERLLESVREKVPRVDATPERELE